MNLSEDLQKLKQLEDDVSLAKQKVIDHKESMLKYSPVKIGDEVTCNRYTNIGKKIVVDRIIFTKTWKDYHFLATGSIKKKDGSIGEKKGEWISEEIRG